MKNFLNTNICFDFSNFSKGSKFYDNQNEMFVGKMKDEYKGMPISAFVGPKSKMRSMLQNGDKESNTVKGVNSVTDFNEVKDTLLNKNVVRHKMKRIQSKKHKNWNI